MKKLFRKIICISIMTAMMVTSAGVPVSAAAFGFSSAVTGVKAVSKSYQSVKVTCQKKSGANGYWYYVATSKNGKYKLAVKAEKNGAVIDGLKTGKTYYFKVRAVKGKSKITKSNTSTPVKCIPRLNKPSAKAVKVMGLFSGYVSWNPVAGAQKYRVYRSKYKTKKYSCIGTVVVADDSKTVFYDNTIKEKNVYYYKVRAFRGDNKSSFSNIRKFSAPKNGNAKQYNLETTPVAEDSPLKDKGIFFLGSSITSGYSSGDISFADYICYQCGAKPYKEAVPATTMAVCANKPLDSYVERLDRLRTDEVGFEPDIVFSQLSMNDALLKNNVELIEEGGEIPDTCRGSISEFNLEDVDTVLEAIEYITVYTHEKWPDSKLAFFTIKNNGSEKYDQMVTLLKAIQEEWKDENGEYPFEILDLWNDSNFMKISATNLQLYMRDLYHPTRAGYQKYWLPAMRPFLEDLITGVENPEEPDEVVTPAVPGDNPADESDQPADEQEQRDVTKPEVIIDSESETETNEEQ